MSSEETLKPEHPPEENTRVVLPTTPDSNASSSTGSAHSVDDRESTQVKPTGDTNCNTGNTETPGEENTYAGNNHNVSGMADTTDTGNNHNAPGMHDSPRTERQPLTSRPVRMKFVVAGRTVDAGVLLTDELVEALALQAAAPMPYARRMYTRKPYDKRGHPSVGPHKKLRADGTETCILCRRAVRAEARKRQRDRKQRLRNLARRRVAHG